MGEVLKGKCPTMKQRNIIKTGIENHQTILLINTSYYILTNTRNHFCDKKKSVGILGKKNIRFFHSE